jgi:hypothetical protein
VKDDVEEYITKLFAKGLIISFIDGFQELINFLQNHGPKSPMGLLSVPRASAGASQPGHNFRQSTNFFHPQEIRGRRAFVESWRDAG